MNDDFLAEHYGSARIRSVTRAGGNVSAIALDGSVPGPSGTGSIGISVQLRNGTIWTRTCTGVSPSAQEITGVSFSPSMADPGSTLLAADCLAVIGKAASEFRRMLVFAVNPEDDLTADVVFVDEAPALAAAI